MYLCSFYIMLCWVTCRMLIQFRIDMKSIVGVLYKS